MNLLNVIRERAAVSWLTTAQKDAYDQLAARTGIYGPAALVGAAGSGKTLIGWLLRRELGLAHSARPHNIPDATTKPSIIIIDNADLIGWNAREAIGAAQLHGWTTAVVIARSIELQGIPAAHLPNPSKADIQRCLANIPLPLAVAHSVGARNLWQAVRWAVSPEILDGI